MDLEKMNTNYGKLKQRIENSEKKYEQLKQSAKKLKAPYYKQHYRLLIAQEEGNTEEINEAKQELEELKRQMKELRDRAIKEKEIIAKSKASIDNKLEKIKNNPETSKQIDKALSVRYERQVNKLTKEKTEIVGKKSGLLIFKDLISDHPSLGNNLKGILYSTRQIKELDDKIKENTYEENGVIKYKDIDAAKELQIQLAEANGKLQKNCELLFDYCDRKKINKEEIKSYINLLVDNGFVEKKGGEIDINATFDKNVKKLDRQINGYDKRINDYSLLINIKQEKANEQNIPNVNKIKWWQFGKRFKNWLENRKKNRLPESSVPTFEAQNSSSERENFNDSLKYDIVRDVMSTRQNEDLKNAKQIRKENEKTNDLDEER